MTIDGGKASWWSVSLFASVMFFSFFDRHLLVLLITPMKISFGFSDTQVSLLIGAVFTIFYLLVGIPVARLIDRGGRKPLLAVGILLGGVATAGLGLAQGFVGMMIARMMQGVGSSPNAPAIVSMIGDMFRRDRLARPIATINIGGAVGSALALMLGGLLLRWIERLPALDLSPFASPEPWQIALLLAAAPAPVLALLILATVREPRRRASLDVAASPGLPEVLRHLGRHRATYATVILAVTVNSALVLGLLVWSPSFFEREYGWAVGEAGPYLGGIILIAAPLGLSSGGWLADRRAARGDAAANVRVAIGACCGLAPAAIAYPLMPGAGLSLLAIACGLFCAMAGLGPANAAIQRITPDRMRGTVTALHVTVVNILGYGFGPLLVALLTDGVYGAEGMLPSAMMLFAATLAPLGLALNLAAMRPYRRSVELERL